MYAYDYNEYRNIRGFYIDLKARYDIPIVNENGLQEIFISDDMAYQVNETLKKVKMLETVDIDRLMDVFLKEISIRDL